MTLEEAKDMMRGGGWYYFGYNDERSSVTGKGSIAHLFINSPYYITLCEEENKIAHGILAPEAMGPIIGGGDDVIGLLAKAAELMAGSERKGKTYQELVEAKEKWCED